MLSTGAHSEIVKPIRTPQAWDTSHWRRLPKNLGGFVDECAAEYGDHILWTFFETGETITYSGLKVAVDRMARALHHTGVRQGTHVAVMLPNIPEFYVIWLGLARLGAVMVPVNVRYTSSEIVSILKGSDASLAVTHQSLVSALERVDEEGSGIGRSCTIVVDGDGSYGLPLAELLDDLPDEMPAWPAVDLDDVVNIQYTSGTTGLPKGCMLTHRYWLLAGQITAMAAERPGRILIAGPMYYMDPQWMLMMTMQSGGQAFVARGYSLRNYMAWVHEHSIDFCWLPNALISTEEGPYDRNHGPLRAAVNEIPKELLPQIEERFNLVARDWFGMTEAGLAIMMPWEATDMVASGSSGIPTPYRELKIVDADGKEVPDGVSGELCIRGPGIMLGFYKNPEATAAAFLAGGWFRTGDLFYKDERSCFHFVARAKEMIRRSNENIAAQEVEMVLRLMPEVAEACAVAVPDAYRGEEVKIYVVLRDGHNESSVPPDAILAHCKQHLAPFKVPRYIEYRTDVPRSASNRIARRKLVAESPDLRAGSYDCVDGVWR